MCYGSFPDSCFCCSFYNFRMTRPIEDTKNINDSKNLWKIVVRIKDLWSFTTMTNKEHLEMVVIDSKVSCNYPLQFEFLKSISSLFRQFFASS